ncbi:MAG: hypothetical protein AB1567_00375 [bacterium]
MKYPLVFLKNKEQGTTLLEFIVGVGILAVIAMVIILFMRQGMDFMVKGVPTKPQEIVKLILEGEEGRTDFEKQGLLSTLRGGYSIYGPQFDVEQPITLGTNSIIIGYGIVDSQNGYCESTVTVNTDTPIINQGSPTTTDLKKGIPTITVISPYNSDNPEGTTSLLLENSPLGDDYGLAVKYEFKQINELRNGRIYQQGELYKTIYHKNSGGFWIQQGTPTLISQHISQLEFRYFTSDEEVSAGIPTGLSKIRQIEMIMITLKVDNNDDRDRSIEEDVLDGRDNDLDGKIDEDYFNGISVTTRIYFRNL